MWWLSSQKSNSSSFNSIESNYDYSLPDRAIVFNGLMNQPNKKISKLKSDPNLERKDGRSTDRWQLDIESSGQRKRYLRLLNTEQMHGS